MLCSVFQNKKIDAKTNLVRMRTFRSKISQIPLSPSHRPTKNVLAGFVRERLSDILDITRQTDASHYHQRGSCPLGLQKEKLAHTGKPIHIVLGNAQWRKIVLTKNVWRKYVSKI